MSIILKFLVFSLLCMTPLGATPYHLRLLSTESDPDAFVHHTVNVIDGSYCESATDLLIAGPDPLLLQRFYSADLTGTDPGGWRFLPERFLVLGSDPESRESKTGMVQSLALAGERSGGILPYKGTVSLLGISEEPLLIDRERTLCMVNTYCGEMNGQVNHHNNSLKCSMGFCELRVGDGSKRVYQVVEALPSQLLGEEWTPYMAAAVINPRYFRLVQETLPSGNQLLFSYDANGHLTAIEMRENCLQTLFSWIHFTYEIQEESATVSIQTSDGRKLFYHFIKDKDHYQLSSIEGSHAMPIRYRYDQEGRLVKKLLPEERFLAISYEDGRVSTLQGPVPLYTFSYSNGHTECRDALGALTSYFFDDNNRLTGIDYYDEEGKLSRREQRFWGNRADDAGWLLAKTIGDDRGRILSYRSFKYDAAGNVIEESLYGNLTGRAEVFLDVDEAGMLRNAGTIECHTKRFSYSSDGFNLLIRAGDCKRNQTLYSYKSGTNRLLKRLVFDKGTIQKRTFYTYNTWSTCIRIMEDDGNQERENQPCSCINERHIREIHPKTTLPGVGLPEIVEEKAVDLSTKRELLVRKSVTLYDDQAHPLSITTYDTHGEAAFVKRYAYNKIGAVILEIDAIGRETHRFYDGVGNEISTSIPSEGRLIQKEYDLSNHCIEKREQTPDGVITERYSYDTKGRCLTKTDRFGEVTTLTYDAFGCILAIIHPPVCNEKGQVLQPTFHYTYDLFHNQLSVRDPLGLITTKSYNLRGSPTRIDHPDGSFELFKYDPEGSLYRSCTRDGVITVYEYDYLGRQVSEETFEVGREDLNNACGVRGPGKLSSKKRGFNGFRCLYEETDTLVRRYLYDPAGRCITYMEFASQSKESRAVDFLYDSLGRLQKKKIWFDQGPEDFGVECYRYDLLDNVLEKWVEDATGKQLHWQGFTYDSAGHSIAEQRLKHGKQIMLLETVYNTFGDSICYRDGSGETSKVEIDYNHCNLLGQNTLKKRLINALGVVTEIEFDALGRIVAIVKTEARGQRLSAKKIFYDALSHKTCEIEERVIDGCTIGSRTTRWRYGPMDRLEEEIESENAPEEKRTVYHYSKTGERGSFAYRAAGKLLRKTVTTAAGTDSISYLYGKEGRLSKIEHRQKNGPTNSESYSYDERGNLINIFSSDQRSTLRKYDGLNQLVEEKVSDRALSYTIQYLYDRKNRIKEVVLPDRSKILYRYDALFGRAVTRVGSDGKILYTHTYDLYDQQGQIEQETLIGLGGRKHSTYDRLGRKNTCENPFVQENYSRDAIGNLTAVSDRTYRYNGLSQLVEERSEEQMTYTYDSLDNRITKNRESLSKIGTISFNAFNQLTKIIHADKSESHFFYDPLGRMVKEQNKEKAPSNTTFYLYLGLEEIGTLSSKGEIETLKIPGLRGEGLSTESIAFEIRGKVYLPLHDIAGNVTHLIDPQTKRVVESYRYSAFGLEEILDEEQESLSDSAVGNPWQFAGKRTHKKSGLTLFGARFYNPSTGRWMTPDPAGDIDGPNKYTYLHNNPLNYFDRFGFASESEMQNRIDNYFYGDVEAVCLCLVHRTCRRGGDLGDITASTLPQIRYCEGFEAGYANYLSEEDFWGKVDLYDDFRPYYPPSHLFNLGLRGLPKDLGIGFINGIDNTFEDAKASVQYISKLSGGYNIHAVYNATHGRMVDLMECRMGLDYCATEPVKKLHAMWDNFFTQGASNARFLMICHSQGAIHVRNALLDYPPELRKRISVIAIAPGGYIYEETCHRIQHYRAKPYRDIVPYLDQDGVKRSQKITTELDSNPNAPLFDHSFLSPTYKDTLETKIEEFLNDRA